MNDSSAITDPVTDSDNPTPKTMWHFVVRLGVFLMLFYGINCGIAWFVRPTLKRNLANKFHWVNHVDVDRLDYALVGSSRVEVMFDPAVIDSRLGTNGINLGVSGGGAADQYLLMRQFLKRNRPSVVLFQIDHLHLSDGFEYPFRDHVWLSYQDDPVVRETLTQRCGLLRTMLWRGVPFWPLMEFRSQYRFSVPADSGARWDRTAGYRANEQPRRHVEPEQREFRQLDYCVDYTRRTIEHAMGDHRRVILVRAPLHPNLRSSSGVDRSVETILRLSDQYGIPFWDDAWLFDDSESFTDNHHLTATAAERYSRLVADRLNATLRERL